MYAKRLLVSASVILASCAVLLRIGGEALGSISTPLTVYPSNRHYFVNDSEPVVLLGAGQVLAGKKTEDYRAYIDGMAAHNVNYGRAWLLLAWDATDNYFPWARDGGGTANDGLPKYNLTHWDSNFWARVKDACAYTQSKNIYLSIMLFDECGMEAPKSSDDHRWDWHPFNPSNNVNGLSLPTSPDCVPEFYNLGDSKLRNLQEQYVSKLISETSGYPNVIYEICNEYTGPWEWEEHWIDFISARCSNIVSVNRLGSIPSAYWTDPSIDMVNFHWGTTYAGTTNSNMVSYYPKNKPINYDEPPERNVTYTDYRKMLWASFVGGGHIHLENGVTPGPALDAVMYARNFIRSNDVRFWEMSPSNSLVTDTPGGSAYTLAKPGSEYVVYIVGSGGGTMTISLVPGIAYAAKAYNPSNGTYTDLTVIGGSISGIPSYSSDIVVYVKATSGPVVSTPDISLSLAVDKSEAAPGDTLTYTLTYTNTGEGEANSVVITCPVPTYTSYVSGSATSGGAYDSTAQAVKWSISTVAPGAGGTLSFNVKVD